MHASRQVAQGGRGFTLFELLIAVAILGILAGIALPLLSAADPVKLERAVGEVVSALDFARGESLRTGTPHGVRVASADHRLRVFRVDTSGASPAEDFSVHHPLDKQLYDRRLEARIGVQVGAVNFSFADGSTGAAVTFDRRGTPGFQPTNNSFIRLTGGGVELSLNGRTRHITVAAETGQVEKP